MPELFNLQRSYTLSVLGFKGNSLQLKNKTKQNDQLGILAQLQSSSWNGSLKNNNKKKNQSTDFFSIQVESKVLESSTPVTLRHAENTPTWQHHHLTSSCSVFTQKSPDLPSLMQRRVLDTQSEAQLLPWSHYHPHCSHSTGQNWTTVSPMWYWRHCEWHVCKRWSAL